MREIINYLATNIDFAIGLFVGIGLSGLVITAAVIIFLLKENLK